MRCNIRITGGRVIDPASGIDDIRDIWVRNSRIVEPEGEPEADEIIDASGCLVLPGLIDFHLHCNRGHSDLGIHPDAMTLPNGITAAVDAGSTGSANFEGFYRDVICASDTTLKAFINTSAVGIITEQYFENPDPALYDARRLEYLFERYRPALLGLKVRIGHLFSREFRLQPLLETRRLADRLETAMCVHAVHPESPYDELLDPFQAGDILCHCFQAKGPYSILDERGHVLPAVRRARERGVIFDAASGRANYSFAVAGQALRDGFYPDVISTDVVTHSMYKRKLFALPYVMSAYLALGMPLHDLVRAVTATPARLMGLAGQIGTLAPGALADIAIFSVREQPMNFNDQFGNTVPGTMLLLPQATFKAGQCAHMRIEFMF